MVQENSQITALAATNFRNEKKKFGIKLDDRRRHVYSIGKTGMGKSTVLENMIISTHHAFLRRGIINQNAVKSFGRNLSKDFSIGTELDVPFGTLSGGNIQKVILSRELAALSDFIMFSEPTSGLDVASAEFIYRKMLECRSNRIAILLISSNLDEILGVADTVVVMYRGRIVGRLPNDGNLTKELIGEYMLGIRGDTSGNEDEERRGDAR